MPLAKVARQQFFVPYKADDGTRNAITVGDTIDDTYISDRINDTDKSKRWYPTMVTGLSGNGKTTMIEQVCAKLGIGCAADADAVPAASVEAQALGLSEVRLAELEIYLEDNALSQLQQAA